jgi:hypothetical protein
MIQHFDYYLTNRFTEAFIADFRNDKTRKAAHEYRLFEGAKLMGKYIKTFRQSGIIDNEFCDEECRILIENFNIDSEVINDVQKLTNFQPPKNIQETADNFEKLEQLEKNLLLLLQINKRRFISSLDLVRSYLRQNMAFLDEFQKEILDMNKIIISLYRAFLTEDIARKRKSLEN